MPAHGSASGSAATLVARPPAGRGGVEAGSCPTPHALSELLPAMFHEDDFALRLVAALDDVLAPALVALDCLWCYLDPRLAPEDFLAWLAGWVGMGTERGWSVERQRALVRQAVELYRWQGTAHGLSAHVALCTGVEVEIIDPGGVAWSETPLGSLPGTAGGAIVVRVTASGMSDSDLGELETIVAAAKPAHVSHRVEIA
ncbi:MAG: phage tail protein [Acidimicrobiales bacterium]